MVFILRSLALAMVLLPCPLLAQVADMCDMMAGSKVSPVSAHLTVAVEKAGAGDWTQAYLSASDTVTALGAKATALFLEADSSKGFPEARAMVDNELIAQDGILAVRKDHFSLRPSVLAWLGWLACRAGEAQKGHYWMRIGQRDHPGERFFADSALLFVANGNLEQAVSYLPSSPVALNDLVASGVIACLNRDSQLGIQRLTQALEMAPEKDPLVAAANRWLQECKAGKLGKTFVPQAPKGKKGKGR